MPVLLVTDEIRSFKFGLIHRREFGLINAEIEIEKETVCLKTKEQLFFLKNASMQLRKKIKKKPQNTPQSYTKLENVLICSTILFWQLNVYVFALIVFAVIIRMVQNLVIEFFQK